MTAPDSNHGVGYALGAAPELIAIRASHLSAMRIFRGCSSEALTPLAQLLRPVHVSAGQVLMRQGEHAVSFLLIQSGTVQIQHTGDDGVVIVDDVSSGDLIGEIALLQHQSRTATVTAATPLTGYIGDTTAFAVMAQLPGLTERMVCMARQRLAAFITPIPVHLADGTELFLRPVLPGDREHSMQHLTEFSSDTFYRRFMSTRAPSATLLNYLFQVDYVNHFAWVLINEAVDADGFVVADARYVRYSEQHQVAEIAFIVADAYQGRGIGDFLMDAVAVAAQVGGVRKLSARMFADNTPMRMIFNRFGASWQRDEPGVVAMVCDVPSGDELRIDATMAAQIRAVATHIMHVIT